MPVSGDVVGGCGTGSEVEVAGGLDDIDGGGKEVVPWVFSPQGWGQDKVRVPLPNQLKVWGTKW